VAAVLAVCCVRCGPMSAAVLGGGGYPVGVRISSVVVGVGVTRSEREGGRRQ